MSTFICAVHAPSGIPRTLALVEQHSARPVRYSVRMLRELATDAPLSDLTSLLASEPQFVAQTTVVTSGGQAVADAIHEAGPSAVAVTLDDDAGEPSEAHKTTTQVLVNTFERLYRAGVVEVGASLDAASPAIDALYAAADLEMAAAESDRTGDGDLVKTLDGTTSTMDGATYRGDGPSASTVQQSGNEASVSTERIEAPIAPAEASAAAVEASQRTGRVASAGSRPADLGEHADLATALALACWYGEVSRDELPTTDKADEAISNRLNRTEHRN